MIYGVSTEFGRVIDSVVWLLNPGWRVLNVAWRLIHHRMSVGQPMGVYHPLGRGGFQLKPPRVWHRWQAILLVVAAMRITTAANSCLVALS